MFFCFFYFCFAAFLWADNCVQIKSNIIGYNQKTNTYTADGNVNVCQTKKDVTRKLFCQHLTYQKKTGRIDATNQISMIDEHGNINYSDNATLSDDFSNGELSPIYVKTHDQERLLGRLLKREDEYKTTIFDGSYTPCKTCKKEDAFWQIDASEVIHDQNDHTITYYHALVRFSGMPIFYMPYFLHTDPSIKRKNGFLFPEVGYIKNTGYYFSPSYFYAIDDYSDLTVSVYAFTKDSIIVKPQYQRTFNNGIFNIESSIHNNKQQKIDKMETLPKTRWHLFSNLQHDINDHQRLKINLRRASDDTYLDHYPIYPGKMDPLTSFIEFEDFRKTSYFNVKSFVYTTSHQKTTPVVLPKIHFEKSFSVPAGFLDTHIMMDHLNRRLGIPGISAKKMTRIWANTTWSKDTLLINHLLTFKLGLDWRVFFYKDYDKSDNKKRNHHRKSFVHPTASVEWQYPLIHHNSHFSYVIEPQAKLIVSPYQNQEQLPIDDSFFFSFDDTTLFLENRAQGYSRFDSGSRFVYGVEQSVTFNDGASISWFFGQTRFLGRTTITDDSFNLTKRSSDIVNNIKYVPTDWMKVRYQSSFDLSKKRERFRELGITLGRPILLLDAGFATYKNPDQSLRVSQLNWSASSKINTNWSVSFGEIRNFKAQERAALRQYASIKWENDCFFISTYMFKSKIIKKELKPNIGFMIEFQMKNIGTFSPITTEKYEKSPLSQF